jgi:biotin--protein ligase
LQSGRRRCNLDRPSSRVSQNTKGKSSTNKTIRFAAVNLDPKADGIDYPNLVKALAEDDTLRVNFLKACLSKLGLTISQETTSVPSLSRLHLSSLHPYLVPELLASWEDIITKEDGEEYIKGENDTFHLEKQDSRWSLDSLAKSIPSPGNSSRDEEKKADELGDSGSEDRIVDYNAITKPLIPHESEWPGTKETPYFNHHAYYANLKRYQEERGSEAEEFGKTLMYGEVVTSTNTMLEKYVLSHLTTRMILIISRNTKLLSKLPPGFTFTATTQVAGRGRGSNVWVSPAGSLVFSVCMKHPIELGNTAPVVFIQYLAAIAIVEGIQSYDKGYKDLPVKLKWPNDICTSLPSLIMSFTLK